MWTRAIILEISIFIIILIGFVFGWQKVLRNPGYFGTAVARVIFIGIVGSICFRYLDFFIVGRPLNELKFFPDVFLPSLIYLAVGYILGETSRFTTMLVNIGAPEGEPSRLSKIANSIGKQMFPSFQTFGKGDVELQIGVSVAAWLYLDSCGSPKRLTTAIGDVFELSTNNRIDLIVHLKINGVVKENVSSDLRKIRKRNRKNTDLNEDFYVRLIRVGINAGVEFSRIEDRLKSTADDLNIPLSRAEEIINSAYTDT